MNEWKKFVFMRDQHSAFALKHYLTGETWLHLVVDADTDDLYVVKDWFRTPRMNEGYEHLDIANNPMHQHFCNQIGLWFVLNCMRRWKYAPNIRLQLLDRIEDERDGLSAAHYIYLFLLGSNRESEFSEYHSKVYTNAEDELLNIPEGIKPPIDPNGVTFYADPYLQGLQG
tara:strand:- start:7706 stop:8218 length:513 start_codon:yes stop_codon:yes gene_type:complete